MDDSVVVKVTRSENQIRITIPKALAKRAKLIGEDGGLGEYTHVAVRWEIGQTLSITPIKMDVS